MEIIGEKSRYALQEHLHLITAPLQVIWGKQDQVTFDVPLIQWLSNACLNTGMTWMLLLQNNPSNIVAVQMCYLKVVAQVSLATQVWTEKLQSHIYIETWWLSCICPGGGCLWSYSHCRGVAWMQSGPAGELWTLCGDGEALSDSQTHPGVHHLTARCQGRHKEIFLNQRLSIISAMLHMFLVRDMHM